MKIEYLEDEEFLQYEVAQLPALQQAQLPKDVMNCLNMVAGRKDKVFRQRKKKNPLQLKQLIKKTKVKMLQQNFVRKLKRTIVYKSIPEQILQKEQIINFGEGSFIQTIDEYFSKTEGISLNAKYQTLWSILNIIHLVMVVIILSFALAFPQTAQVDFFSYIRIISSVLYLFDMVLNFITQRQELGKTKKSLKQIGVHYLCNEFIPDMISIVMVPFSFALDTSNLTIFMIIVVILKLNNNLKKFEKFQYLYITKSERQQYYGLLKVFILNFAIGHILSILLNLMAGLNPQECWYDKIGIKQDPWIYKYIWGYYWGTTIMLTVGFGDVSATNHNQALLLIFIETFACITLAYNINYVGSIISEMKADNEEKKKKLKYFHKMCKENQITQELENKICNFIEESYQIKEAFEFDEYEQVLETLPKNIHSEYIKECNKHLFEVPFFNSLNKKTILSLAEAVCRRITHPDQIIKRKGERSDFTILQRGTIGLVCRRNKSILNGTVIETFSAEQNQKPKILSLDFIKRKILNYEIRSLCYSVIYYLDYQNFMQSLKECDMDFDLFCVMKDKDDFVIGQNELYKCPLCVNQFHNRFQCPKYHYKPLNQHVISNYFKKIKSFKQPRNAVPAKRQYKDDRCLLYAQSCKVAHQKYLQEYLDENYINEILNIEKYYKEKIRVEKELPAAETIEPTEHDSNFEKQMNKIEELFVKHAHNVEDFWLVECDSAYNFKYYFNNFNPSELTSTRMTGNGKKGMTIMRDKNTTLFPRSIYST